MRYWYLQWVSGEHVIGDAENAHGELWRVLALQSDMKQQGKIAWIMVLNIDESGNRAVSRY